VYFLQAEFGGKGVAFWNEKKLEVFNLKFAFVTPSGCTQ